MKKKKVLIDCLAIIAGSFLGAFLISLLLPGLKEDICIVALGVSAGIILGRYVIKKKEP